MSTASGTYSMRQISSCHPFHHASPGCGPGITNVLNFRIFKVRQHCCHPLCDMPHYQSPTWVQRPKPTPHAESRRTIRFTMRRLAVVLQSEMSSIFAFLKSHGTIVNTLSDMPHYQSHLWISHPRPTQCAESRRAIPFPI